MGTGAVSRKKLSRRQKSVKVQDFNCGQMRALPTEAERRWVSGCNGYYEFVLVAGALPAGRQESKNRDKQLTFIVRVSISYY
jgi:hypothetical protein